MEPNEKIVVIAGGYEQFRMWVKSNIIPVTNMRDTERLNGLYVHEVHLTGTSVGIETLDYVDQFIRARGKPTKTLTAKGKQKDSFNCPCCGHKTKED